MKFLNNNYEPINIEISKSHLKNYLENSENCLHTNTKQYVKN